MNSYIGNKYPIIEGDRAHKITEKAECLYYYLEDGEFKSLDDLFEEEVFIVFVSEGELAGLYYCIDFDKYFIEIPKYDGDVYHAYYLK